MPKDNKLIAKNTAFLYGRMLLVLLVTLYTSRVVLNTLGVEDYGVYNVVGGMVYLFAFLNSSLASATQRFYNYEDAKGQRSIQQVYMTTLLIEAALAIILVALLETAGLWYLNHVMVVAPDRLNAAHVVFQTSVAGLVLLVMGIPYSSIILAKEKMDFYALVSIVDVLLRLGLVLALPHIPHDKLVVYSCFNLTLTAISFLLYFGYAKYHFKEIRFAYRQERRLFIEMLSFSWWNIVGTFAFMLKNQGVNMLLNFFFGTAVNAARGVSFQVLSALSGFTNNIVMAFRPQLISSYASGEYERTKKMMFSESKICFVLACTLIVPLAIELPYVLDLWLKGLVPEYTVPFTLWILLDMLLRTINAPLTQVSHATGKVKTYSLIAAATHILILPVAWLLFKFGADPVSAFVVCVVMTVANQIGGMMVVNKYFHFGLKEYMGKVILPCMAFAILLPIIPWLLSITMESSPIRLVLVCLSSVMVAVVTAWFLILNSTERTLIFGYLPWNKKKHL